MQAFLGHLRRNLSSQIFLALVLGTLTGLFFGEYASVFSFIGDIFLRLFQMPVIPYIIVAIIGSLGRLDYQSALTIFVKGGIVLIVFWLITLVIVILYPLGFPSWQSSAFFSTSLLEPPKSLSLIELFIPSNPFHSLANTIVPSLVLFCIALGLALITIPQKQEILRILDILNDALLKVTQAVSKITPYGVFAIVANAAGTLPLEAFKRLGVYILIQASIALILSFWLLPRLIAILTPLKYKDIIQAYRTPLITAFAVANLMIVLPLIIERSRQLLQKLAPPDDPDSLIIDAPLEVLVPVSFVFPSIGKLMSLGFVPFASWYSGSTVPLSQYPAYLLGGLASLFGDGISTMRFLLNLLGLPADMLQIYVTLEQISVARFGTLVAGMSTIGLSLIATCAINQLVTLRLQTMIRFAVVNILIILLALGSIHSLFTYGLRATYTDDAKLSALKLLRVRNKPQAVKVHQTVPVEVQQRAAAILAASQGSLTPEEMTSDILMPDRSDQRWQTIKQQKKIRICYAPKSYPLAYFNSLEPVELVGFNIEMGYILAQDLGLQPEFWPLANSEQEAFDFIESAAFLQMGYCDILMTFTPITPRYAEVMDFTETVDNYTLAFLVQDKFREQFTRWQALQPRSNLKIGVLANSDIQYYRAKLMGLLPNAKFVDVDSYESFLEDENAVAAGMVTFAESGAAWTILYPDFSIAIPKPVVAIPSAYGLPRGETTFKGIVNAWIQLKQQDGTIHTLYDYWIQGKTESAEPPRWSILNHLLNRRKQQPS